MKIAFAAVLALAVTACAAPAPAPAPPAPVYSEQWFSLKGAPGDYAGLNIHQTALGYAGRLVTARGDAMPLRGIERDGDIISFDIPALGDAFTGHLTPDGWFGDWMVNGSDAGLPVTLVGGSSAPSEEGMVVTISGGRKIHLICQGDGSPAVILDYGAGGVQKRDWAGLTGFIVDAAHTRVCTYDRAGRGISDPGALPRDVNAVVKDLDEALAAAQIAPPYVLVGHSLGSYHVRQYANMHFGKMAGMVLVDPSGDGQTERFAAAVPKMVEIQNKTMAAQAALNCAATLRAAPVKRTDPLAIKCQSNDPDAIEATTSEIDAMPGASTSELRASHRSYGDMPLIVLTRGDYDKGMPADMTAEDRAGMKQVWQQMHAEMAALSARGEQRFIPGAGHYVQRDAPQAVVDAIAQVVAMARAAKP